jgi:hypothetical protein
MADTRLHENFGSCIFQFVAHGEGVLEGDCKVAIIVAPKSGKRVIAERYADFEKADINFTVAPRDENYLMYDVKR